MIEVREAVGIAKKYFVDLMGETAAPGVRLEEVEIIDEGPEPFWNITLSTPVAADAETKRDLHTLAGVFRTDIPREYKVFRINAKDGQVKSMKIRRFNGE